MAFSMAIIPKGLSDNKELFRLFSKFKRTMSDKDKEVRWVPPQHWHVNVQYIGSLSAIEKEKLVEHLRSWVVPEIFRSTQLRIHGVGAFPAGDRARSLWWGVQKSHALLELKEVLYKELSSFGFPAEDREYNPHVTLAKFRNPVSANELLHLGGRKHFGDYSIGEVALFESIIQGHMTKYIPVFQKEV